MTPSGTLIVDPTPAVTVPLITLYRTKKTSVPSFSAKSESSVDDDSGDLKPSGGANVAQASGLRFFGMRLFKIKYTIGFNDELHLVVFVLNRM